MSRFRTQNAAPSLGGHSSHARRLQDGASRCLFRPLEERLHRFGGNPVTDRRVRAVSVVATLDVVDDRAARLVSGGPFTQAVHLVLERAEEGFRHRVVVAAAGAPDGEPDLVLVDPASQQPGGVLRAAVGMEYGVAGDVAALPGRLERLDDDVCGHALRDRPVDDHARAQVDHDLPSQSSSPMSPGT